MKNMSQCLPLQALHIVISILLETIKCEESKSYQTDTFVANEYEMLRVKLQSNPQIEGTVKFERFGHILHCRSSYQEPDTLERWRVKTQPLCLVPTLRLVVPNLKGSLDKKGLQLFLQELDQNLSINENLIHAYMIPLD